jgi:hypothetical protein
MDLLGFFKGNICFLKLKYVKNPLYRPSRTGSPDRGCVLAPCGPRVAGSPLAAASDPVGCRAARRGAGERVALSGSGWPQRIRADWLWPRLHVATRAPPNPVFESAILGARPNVCKGDGGAERPRRRRVPRRLGVWPTRGDYLELPWVAGLERRKDGSWWPSR